MTRSTYTLPRAPGRRRPGEPPGSADEAADTGQLLLVLAASITCLRTSAGSEEPEPKTRRSEAELSWAGTPSPKLRPQARCTLATLKQVDGFGLMRAVMGLEGTSICWVHDPPPRWGSGSPGHVVVPMLLAEEVKLSHHFLSLFGALEQHFSLKIF